MSALPPRSALNRRAVLGLAAAAMTLPLAACGEKSDLAKQAADGDGKNYIAGDGSVEEFAKDKRGEPISFEAPLFSGKTVKAEDYRGQVLVINFWYASCAPCRTEAPVLKELSAKYKGKGAAFLGANVRDEKETAEAFERAFGIAYPSVRDIEGKVLLALSKYVPLKSVPVTVVVDPEGRVAARILGAADKSTLDTLIKDNIA
ncbi:TlpA disulfide reductase family protein [Falsarthrobacter nasiphocae]|uniref:Thiol-disulfide isomerase/thioredoxin n=2 Tax=Micrococcaceae TaxID=1268 RepID=A0AAE4C7B2_9MICC|nr:TlpA disulfide reductase family protein [Falsarthrobacter nasiphocae]MDR6892374.1 thiol-disulfide isomerase/thioredoxin [Falsarthrobacter nasiphocae]